MSDISFTIKLTGAEQVERALRGLARTHQQTADEFLKHELRKTQAVDRETKQRTNLYEKMFREIEKDEAKQTKSAEQESKKRQSLAEREAKEELNIVAKSWQHKAQMQKSALAEFRKASNERRRMLEQEEAQQRKNMSTGLNVAGHLAGTAGSYQFGHLLRAGSGLTQAGFSSAALGGLGVAMAAIAATIAVTEMAFKSLVTQVEYVGSSFASAIMQIGGAKNLQEQIVETAKHESSIAHARLTVSGPERMSQDGLRNWSAKMSETAVYGGHDSSEWDAAAKVLGAQTGKQASILNDPAASRIIGQVANIADVAPSVSAGLYSQIYNQNKNQSSADVAARIRDVIGIGQAGQLSVADIASEGGGVASLTNQLGGGFTNDLHAVFGAASLIKSKTSTNSLNQAGTEIQAFIRESNLHADQAKGLGATFNDSGSITNFNDYLANVATMKRDELPHWLQGRETAPFLGNIRSGVGLSEGETGDAAKAKALAALDSQSKLTASEGEMADMAKAATKDLEELKTAFNKLQNALEPRLNKILHDMTDKLTKLSSRMDIIAPHLGNALQQLADAAVKSIPAILLLLSTLAGAGGALAAAGEGAIAGSPLGMIPGMDKVFNALQAGRKGAFAAAGAAFNLAGQTNAVINAPPTPDAAPAAPAPTIIPPLNKMEPATPVHAAGSSRGTDTMVQAIKEAADELKRAAKMQQDTARLQKDNARGTTTPGEF